MGRVGFIQDKLEIKFLILYVAAPLQDPLPVVDVEDQTIWHHRHDIIEFLESKRSQVE